MPELYPYQMDALRRMHNGCILCGGVGSGKSRTALAYYYISNGGELDSPEGIVPMDDIDTEDLYIITTARKRDTLEWEGEMLPFLMSPNKEYSIGKQKIVIDSWNNIKKYADVENAFFIFDEQRVVGYGRWAKTFIKLAKHNKWILLSATPGDKWEDYAAVFIANGFYKNLGDFQTKHIVWAYPYKYHQVERYLAEGRLIRLRNNILVNMDFERKTVSHTTDLFCSYDIKKYKELVKTRWDKEKNKPIESPSEFCYALRKIVNSDISRADRVLEIFREKRKVIVFYNFDYELDILRKIPYGGNVTVAEWNGHQHQPVPQKGDFVYLVQYTAGAEGWNCITTDTIIFYSMNYSYKSMEQARGRIDRLNTPFADLYYYNLTSGSSIDKSIRDAIMRKKDFNLTAFSRSLKCL